MVNLVFQKTAPFYPLSFFYTCFISFPPSRQGKKGNFEMYHDGEFFGNPYDYESIMHYGPNTFSKCKSGCQTIETLDPDMQKVLIHTFMI